MGATSKGHRSQYEDVLTVQTCDNLNIKINNTNGFNLLRK